MFFLIQESTSLHSDRNITLVSNPLKKSQFKPNIPKDLNNYTFNKYIQIFIKVSFNIEIKIQECLE
jgi:hypothetical protein